MKTLTGRTTLIVLFLAVCAVRIASAALIIAPGAQAAVEGNGNNAFPFAVATFGVSSQRYQQVFASTEFSSLGGPALISQIAFRPDKDGNSFASTLPNIQINLSTSTAAPDALSATFSANVGANDTTVFSGPLAISSAFTGPVNGPKAFDILINLMTPFLYNPAAGNLLLDVRNFGGGGASVQPFDLVSATDSVSRVVSTSSSGVNDVSGLPDSGGLIARFTTTPVPEPAGIFTGLLCLGLAALRRRRLSPDCGNGPAPTTDHSAGAVRIGSGSRICICKVGLAVLAAAVLAGRADAAVMVYSNDFQGAVGSEWSHSKTSVTPLGFRRFLGDFLNDQVTLSLGGLPAHDAVNVTFQLFIINSWDGNDSSPGDPNPDIWDLSVAGGPTLLHSTFAIVDSNPAAASVRQAYPDAYPGGSHFAETGASETDTLGYIFFGSHTDAVYNMDYTFAHTASSLAMQFSGIGLERLNDESWGIDNVAVSLVSVPEAGTTCFGFALWSLSMLHRRREIGVRR